MNEVAKQRLVGALILLALGVVFWPIIFVDPGAGLAEGELNLPPRPQVDTTPLEPPSAEGLRVAPEHLREPDAVPAEAVPESAAPEAPAPTEAAAPPPAAGETRSEAPEKPALDEQGIPIAWVLQVVSVSDAARADALRDELLEMGYRGYVQRVRNGDKNFYRVCIGPKVEKARLEAIRAEVDKRFGVHSLVTRYYP